MEPGRPDDLFQPVDEARGTDHGARGIFDDRSHDRSQQLWLAQHARASSGVVAGAVVAGALLAWQLGRRR